MRSHVLLIQKRHRIASHLHGFLREFSRAVSYVVQVKNKKNEFAKKNEFDCVKHSRNHVKHTRNHVKKRFLIV